MRLITYIIKFIITSVLVFFITVIISSWYTGHEIGTNKTVGWAWDLSSFILPLTLVFMSLYITTFIFKIKTNAYLTVLSVVLLLTCYFFLNNQLVFIALFTLSILLFVANIIYSLISKVKKSK